MTEPLAVTMGRTQSPSRWVPPREGHAYLKETTAILSLICAILAACLLLYRWDDHERKHNADWVNMPWVSSFCKIQSVGVAYRGTCPLGTSSLVAPDLHFMECMSPQDVEIRGAARDQMAVHKQWLQTEAGRCAASGDREYQLASALATAENPSIPRRLHMVLPHRASQMCHNGYVAWAALVPNRSGGVDAPVCAYHFGSLLSSVTDKWGEVHRDVQRLTAAYALDEEIPCWQLNRGSR